MNLRRFQSLTRRQVSVVSALIICLLIGSLVGVPWFFASAYDGSERHVITHESTETFNESVEGNQISTDNPTPVSELSPTARTIVEQTIAEGTPQSEVHTRGSEDWVRYDAVFCNDEMPVCDEYEERPDDFTYYPSSLHGVYTVIETDDGLYLLKTGEYNYGVDRGPFSGLEAKHIIFVTIIVPVVAVLAFVTTIGQLGLISIDGGTSNQRVILGLALYAILLTVVGIIDPFLEMYFGVSFSQDLLGPGILLTWGILFAAIVYPFFDT